MAAVLAAPADWRPGTAAVVAGLADSLARLLEGARAAGTVRADLTPDDLRRLICGVRAAVGAGDRQPGDLDRYLSILLAGLRPDPDPLSG